jgi:hypothetical protein
MGAWAASSLKEVSMNGKRLALAAFLAAVVIAVAGGQGSSTGQTQGAPGVTYGGVKDQYPAWLRFDPSRRSIAATHIEWTASPERCSNRRAYRSTLFAGYEWRFPISVDDQGKFRKTVVDRYTEQGSRHVDHQVVNGTITDDVVTGSISGRARIVNANGRVVRCTFGPQRWRLVD